MKQKKVPMRLCLGCREMKPKREMIRVVKNKEGEISIDFKGKAAGRGAYICHDRACLEKAIKSRILEKNFECAIGDEVIEILKKQWSESEQGEE